MSNQKADVLDIYDKDGNKVYIEPMLPECTVEVFDYGCFYRLLQRLFRCRNRQE